MFNCLNKIYGFFKNIKPYDGNIIVGKRNFSSKKSFIDYLKIQNKFLGKLGLFPLEVSFIKIRLKNGLDFIIGDSQQDFFDEDVKQEPEKNRLGG